MDTLSPAVTLPCPACPTTLDRSLHTESPWSNMSYSTTETISHMWKKGMGVTSQSLMLFYLTQLSSRGTHRGCKGVSDFDLDLQ